jgi:hypothetical protein
VYRQAFQKAGFTSFEWVIVTAAGDNNEYDDYIKYPSIIGILARKWIVI